MATWTPIEIFGLAIVLAALAALGTAVALERSFTLRSVLEALLRHGILGGSIGLAAYEWFGLKDTPGLALVIAAIWGALIRIPEIHFDAGEVKKLLQRIIRSLLPDNRDES